MTARFILLLALALFLSVPNAKAQSVKDARFEKRVSFQFGIGRSYYTFKDTGEEIIASHNDKWRNAFNFNALIGFHPNEKWMLSLTSSLHQSEGRTDGIVAVGQGVNYSGYFEDNVQVFSMGVNAERTVLNFQTFSFSYHMGVNIFYLENNGRLIVDDFKLSGTDFGFRIGINGTYEASNQISLVGQIQYALNVLGNPTYEVTDPKIPVTIPSQDMSRVEFNIGIRYSFLKKTQPKKKSISEPEDDYVPRKRFE